MRLWRISGHRELDGVGGLVASARWHTIGRPVVYSAPNSATALVEVLVHMEVVAGELPRSLQYLEIDAPDTISTARLSIRKLGPRWRKNDVATRNAGDDWLQSGRTAVLQVPSAIVPATWNFLVNPRHPESGQVRVVRVHRHTIDPRLVR